MLLLVHQKDVDVFIHHSSETRAAQDRSCDNERSIARVRVDYLAEPLSINEVDHDVVDGHGLRSPLIFELKVEASFQVPS